MSSSATAPYVALLLLGAANLVPWMTFLALPDYFAQLYNSNAMEFYFPVVSTASLVTTMACLLVFGSQLSFHARIPVPTACMTVLMLEVPIVDTLVAWGFMSLDVAFALTLVTVCLNAVLSATMQNSLYALASLIGESATQGVQTGSGIIGLISVFLRIATKLGLAAAPAMWSFCVLGAAILLASLMAYSVLMNDEGIRDKVQAQEQRREAENRTRKVAARSAQLAEPMLGAAEVGAATSKGQGGAQSDGGGAAALLMLRTTCIESACVFIVFFVCLSIFPGLTTSLTSTSWHLGSWYPILLVAAYNTGDLVGKSLPGMLRVIDSKTLPYCVAAHTLFVPALLLLSHPSLLPAVLRSDVVALAVVLKLGISTGYIGCMALILGSERATTNQAKEVAGMVTSFSLAMGLACGSTSGLVLAQLVSR